MIFFPFLFPDLPAVVERASVTIGESTSYNTVGTFGELGRMHTDDINKVFQQTGIPTGEGGRGLEGWGGVSYKHIGVLLYWTPCILKHTCIHHTIMCIP